MGYVPLFIIFAINRLSKENFTFMKATFKYLTQEELNDPGQVFTNFFEFLRLDEVKAMFRQLEYAALKQFAESEFCREDIIYFFERLEKVMEAGWLVR
jgi:ethanolamine utilization cobalamin adenosyltransferase